MSWDMISRKLKSYFYHGTAEKEKENSAPTENIVLRKNIIAEKVIIANCNEEEIRYQQRNKNFFEIFL